MAKEESKRERGKEERQRYRAIKWKITSATKAKAQEIPYTSLIIYGLSTDRHGHILEHTQIVRLHSKCAQQHEQSSAPCSTHGKVLMVKL